MLVRLLASHIKDVSPAKDITTSLLSKTSHQSFRLFSTSWMSSQEHRLNESIGSDGNSQRPRLETLNHLHNVTHEMDFSDPSKVSPVPSFRVLNQDGTLCGDKDPDLSADKIIELYKGMVVNNILDKIAYDIQRQGRISFYMTAFGEEAASFGSASALDREDWIYAQYREAGALICRGMDLKLMMAQCYGTHEDLGKGRQMPIHYGNRALNYVTISSPLTTQLPQAVGTAYSFKMDTSSDKKRIVICYFGEGAASEGDAHAAMNFAATLSCPVIFFCRNNGYAISTAAREQYVSDGIVTRGLGYGMSSIRVDGNDLFAVYTATKEARRICVDESRPVLIEAMTYRVGHHSTSDDSSAYRDMSEVKQWETDASPIKRVYNYLLRNGLWTDADESEINRSAREQVIEAINHAEKQKRLPIMTMFDDVYDKLPANLRRQRDELKHHLEQYGEHYPIDQHEGV